MRVGEHTSVTVAVPVLFQNEEASPGIKRGGVLNVVRHELELVCDAASIPDNVIVDLTGTDVGDAIHISHVKFPAGATPAIDDRAFTIATFVAPYALKKAEGEAAAAEGDEERSEGTTSDLPSLMRISYAASCLNTLTTAHRLCRTHS